MSIEGQSTEEVKQNLEADIQLAEELKAMMTTDGWGHVNNYLVDKIEALTKGLIGINDKWLVARFQGAILELTAVTDWINSRLALEEAAIEQKDDEPSEDGVN
jgi:hypothetical protein